MVAKISRVLNAAREFEALEELCESARQEAEMGKRLLERAEAGQASESASERAYFAQQMEERAPIFHNAIRRHEDLEFDLLGKKQALFYARQDLEKALENTLIEKKLYNVAGVSGSDTVQAAGDARRTHAAMEEDLPQQYRPRYNQSDVTSLTSEERFEFNIPTDRQVQERFQMTLRRLHGMQELFDTKERDGEHEIRCFHEALRNGETLDYSEADVRKWNDEKDREITLNLINAEFEYQEAREEYKRFGFETQSDNEQMALDDMQRDEHAANYEDHIEESDPGEMASWIARKDYSKIEAWVRQVKESQQGEIPAPEVDPWGDDKSVSISSALSMVNRDDAGTRKQIDRWRGFCASLRDAPTYGAVRNE